MESLEKKDAATVSQPESGMYLHVLLPSAVGADRRVGFPKKDTRSPELKNIPNKLTDENINFKRFINWASFMGNHVVGKKEMSRNGTPGRRDRILAMAVGCLNASSVNRNPPRRICPLTVR